MSSQLSNTVVLIEDEPVIAATVTYIVESCGVAVETSAGLESGVALVQRVRPRLILLDVELCDGSGLDLCTAIRLDPELGRATIVLVSTHDSESLRGMAETAGADGFLCKPFDPDQLVGLVRTTLGTTDQATQHAS